MGYFSNGSEGDDYQRKYCDRCVHWQNGNPCAVWFLHMVRNYDDCNNKESALHVLIPRKGIENEQCKMFAKSEG